MILRKQPISQQLEQDDESPMVVFLKPKVIT